VPKDWAAHRSSAWWQRAGRRWSRPWHVIELPSAADEAPLFETRECRHIARIARALVVHIRRRRAGEERREGREVAARPESSNTSVTVSWCSRANKNGSGSERNLQTQYVDSLGKAYVDSFHQQKEVTRCRSNFDASRTRTELGVNEFYLARARFGA
jgi:hypothetical protein